LVLIFSVLVTRSDFIIMFLQYFPPWLPVYDIISLTYFATMFSLWAKIFSLHFPPILTNFFSSIFPPGFGSSRNPLPPTEIVSASTDGWIRRSLHFQLRLRKRDLLRHLELLRKLSGNWLQWKRFNVITLGPRETDNIN
jgi:hypothetical protein